MAEARTWGRVEDDGTVLVRTADGERSVGQMPDATPEEALSFFARRYVDLLFEVDLLERRVERGSTGPRRGGRLGQAGPRQRPRALRPSATSPAWSPGSGR